MTDQQKHPVAQPPDIDALIADVPCQNCGANKEGHRDRRGRDGCMTHVPTPGALVDIAKRQQARIAELEEDVVNLKEMVSERNSTVATLDKETRKQAETIERLRDALGTLGAHSNQCLDAPGDQCRCEIALLLEGSQPTEAQK